MLRKGFRRRGALKMVGVGLTLGALAAGISVAGSLDGDSVKAASGTPPKTKNVIVMISDGCGYNHIKATDYYTGATQPYENFPVTLGMSTYEYEDTAAKIGTGATKNLLGYDPTLMWKDFTYSAYPLATDSASAATAMASGKKTYNGAIGVDVTGVPLTLLTQRAEQLGKATGVVTSVEWSHATPAGFVAHNTSRNNYAAIAQEMISSSATDVIMGAGNPDFDDNGVAASKDAKYVGGTTLWSELKVGAAGGDANADGTADPWTLIQTKAEFEALATAGATPSRVCGTAQVYSTLQQARSGNGDALPYAVPLNGSVPSLATMTKGALNVLDNDKDGFFLMIEGGAIDWAAHASQTGRMIEEEMDFNAAVKSVIAWVEKYSDWSETMVIVSGDHETGMLWGPGSGTVDGKARFSPVVNNGKGNLPSVSWGSSEHTNELIPLFAKGAAATWLRDYAKAKDPVYGPYIDNTDIADLIFTSLR